MRNRIGQIHDTRDLTPRIKLIEDRIKLMLNLDTVEITVDRGGFYSVTTDDSNIVDFKLDQDNNDKISLVKCISYDEQGHRDFQGAMLTCPPILAKEV